MSTTSLQVPNLLSQSSSGASTPRRGIVVFSGGSAANSLVDVFDELAEHRQCSLNYIIPISDNGGSSSELIRVFGGPGIGDIRSMHFMSHDACRTFLFLSDLDYDASGVSHLHLGYPSSPF